MIPEFATSSIALLNQDVFTMYLFAPLIALWIYIIIKLFSNFKW